MAGILGVEVNTALQRTQYTALTREDETDASRLGMTDKNVQNEINDKNPSGVQQKRALGIEECQTCKNRTYQDGSNDPGVSFKSPTRLSPGQAASAVFSHEREHYTREEANARDNDREVVSNDIRIFTAVCPECGKTYVSGGETRTTTRQKAEQASFAKQFFDEKVGIHLPQQIDVTV